MYYASIIHHILAFLYQTRIEKTPFIYLPCDCGFKKKGPQRSEFGAHFQ